MISKSVNIIVNDLQSCFTICYNAQCLNLKILCIIIILIPKYDQETNKLNDCTLHCVFLVTRCGPSYLKNLFDLKIMP